MNQRFIYLAFENLKRTFYKKTTIGFVIGLAFVIGYAATLFLIEESNLEVEFTSNDFVLYFLNDFSISGIFINVLFIIFITGMFTDDLNYMYLSRLKGTRDTLKAWIISIFMAAMLFMLFILIVVFVVGGIIKDYSSNWSSAAYVLSLGTKDMSTLKEILSPINCIIISSWMYVIGLLIVGICFYIGFCIFKGIGGGVLLNIALLSIGVAGYFTKIEWLYKISPNINTLFIFHSLKGSGVYQSMGYSLIYILIVLILLYSIASVASKKYIKDKV